MRIVMGIKYEVTTGTVRLSLVSPGTSTRITLTLLKNFEVVFDRGIPVEETKGGKTHR
jgi:hypothetical protein